MLFLGTSSTSTSSSSREFRVHRAGSQLKRNKRIAGYSKLEDMKYEDKCEMRDYIQSMTMQQARTKFRIRARLINCAMNQPSDPKHIANLWKCSACSNVDSMSHILWCPAYKSLREGKSLENDLDIVQYYQKVMTIREKLNLET